MKESCVIVGGGHGGSQIAVSLRQEGFQGRVILINDEHDLPYHKPPLSKSFLKTSEGTTLVLRPESTYRDNAIDLVLGARVEVIDRQAATVKLSDGTRLGYGKLILATGARAFIPPLEGTALEGVHSLRNVADARKLNDAVAQSHAIAIIGAGYIGMELAHTLSALGRHVTLIEAAPRILGRSVATAVSHHVQQRTIATGIDIVLGAKAKTIEGSVGRVAAVRLTDGRTVDADLVLIGAGAVPNLEIATAVGLAVDNGVMVNAHMQTSDPNILAIGDCVNFSHWHARRQVRLESVQNATDQAKNAAKTILGHAVPFQEVPWFWSDQGDMKLQTAGIAFDADRFIVSGSPDNNAFAVYHYSGSRLLAVDTVNRAAEHMVARRLLAAGIDPTPHDIEAGLPRLKEMLTHQDRRI